MRKDDLPEILTRAQAAEILGISIVGLDRIRKSGKLGFVRVGRLVRHTPEDIGAFIKTARGGEKYATEKHN